MKNVFLLGLDEFNLPEVDSLQRADTLRIHKLLEADEVTRPQNGKLDFEAMRQRAEAQLDDFDGSIDGIAAHWDFPSSALVGVLRKSRGLPGPSNESICCCEHKYWSRLEQKRAVPDMVPPFAAVDPFRDDPLKGVDIDYPFWIKPIKAHSSHLGFMIRNAEDLYGHLPEIREKIGLFGDPFEQYLRHVNLPDDEPVPEREISLSSPLTVGLFAGKWCSYAAGPDLAHDQRQEDGGALVFETRPLEEHLEVCGAVTGNLVLSVDRPVALIALRLSDVLPDGRVTRVTYGLLNLTHRDGSENPRPMEPG